jgi:hypothetical protein
MPEYFMGWVTSFLGQHSRIDKFNQLCISKMYFSYWNPPGVSARMWSVNLDELISGEYQTPGGHSCQPSE